MQKLNTKVRGTLIATMIGILAISLSIIGCGGGDGGNAVSVTTPPAPGLRTASGIVYDPIVIGATVSVIDSTRDAIVASGVTGNDGRFSFQYPGETIGYMEASGGIHTDGGAFTGVYFAPMGATVLSSGTTLLVQGWPHGINDATIYALMEIAPAQRTWASILSMTNPLNHPVLANGSVALEVMAQCLDVFLPGNRLDAFQAMANGRISSFNEVALANFLASLTLANDGVKLSSQEAAIVAAVMRDLFEEAGSATSEADRLAILNAVRDHVAPALTAFMAGQLDQAGLMAGYTGVALHALIYGGGGGNGGGQGGQASQYACALESNNTVLKFYDGATPYIVELVGDFVPNGWSRPGAQVSSYDLSGLGVGQYRFGGYDQAGNLLPYWEAGFAAFRVSNGQGGWVLALTVKADGTIVPGLQ